MQVTKVSIYHAEHIGCDAKVTRFTSAKVHVPHESPTWHNSFFTEWVTVIDGKPYICSDEFGECWVDFADEYTGEEIPLIPLKEIQVSASIIDEPTAVFAARASLDSLGKALGIDLSQINIVNL